jgi:AcrR family transcriptional regulator
MTVRYRMVMSLSKADWTESALLALARDGLTGVAVEPLARRLNATKGSFYWHFANRAELIAATLELWEQHQTTEVIEHIRAISDPRDRLVALGTGAYADAAQGNAHAAVLAAASDPQVAPVLERVTRTRLTFLQELYCDLGNATDDAARRARMAYALYLGIGELYRADPDNAPAGQELHADLELAIDLMTSPPNGSKE